MHNIVFDDLEVHAFCGFEVQYYYSCGWSTAVTQAAVHDIYVYMFKFWVTFDLFDCNEIHGLLQRAVFRHISPGIFQSKSESNYTQMCI